MNKTKTEHCEHLNENGSCDYPNYKCCDAWINWAGEKTKILIQFSNPEWKKTTLPGVPKEAEWFCKQSKEFRLKHGDIWMG